MPEFILRVEGVNLSNVIDDTNQLSIRRGGGLMILNAARELKGLLPAEISNKLTDIATGASIALFVFEAESSDAAQKVRDQVAQTLLNAELEFKSPDHGSNDRDKLPLSHGTFVIDVAKVKAEEESAYQQAEQRATAANRWRQLQSPSLSLDGLWASCQNDADEARKKEHCEFDRVRPVSCFEQLNGKKRAFSKSTHDRWRYGRGARGQFYANELSSAMQQDAGLASQVSSLDFTDNLQDLGAFPDFKTHPETKAAYAAVPDNLKDKLAVFYVDGNGFGSKGRAIFQARGTDGFGKWSRGVQGHHQLLLQGLLQLAIDDPTWKIGKKLRLETLLWGGDEILWVVPAWKGWQLASWFFSQSHQLTLEGGADSTSAAKTSTEDLTYGCGLVFCHSKAPIKNICKLAHDLGDLAKDARSDQEKHCLAYEVLESIDDVSGDLSQHRKRFLPSDHDLNDLILEPSRLASLMPVLQQLASSHDFPQRQLYKLTQAWRRGKTADAAAAKDRLVKACNEAKVDIDKLLVGLQGIDGETDSLSHSSWFQLQQILPYTNFVTANQGGEA